MSKRKINEDQLWYGFLEAGDKSSPVVLDPKMDTGSPQTVYLYNLKRNEILEYRRDIVDPKLRDLAPEETDVDVLNRSFGEARRNFKGKGPRFANVPERGKAAAPAPEEAEPDVDLVGAEGEADDEEWSDDE